MNTFLFFCYGIQMSYFFFLIQSKSTNIENRVQIRSILYSSQPIRLQIFFRVSDNDNNSNSNDNNNDINNNNENNTNSHKNNNNLNRKNNNNHESNNIKANENRCPK